MSFLRKREIPLFITGLVGFLTISEFYFDVGAIRAIMAEVYVWGVAIAAYCLFLGAINLLKIHLGGIRKRTPGKWYFSAWLIVVMLIFMGVGIAEQGVQGPSFLYIFNNILFPIDSTMFAMLAFFIASACYRVMRVRNIESLLLVIAAIFIVFQNAPLGGAIWPMLPVIGTWINNVPSAAAMRAYVMAVAIGSIGLGVRLLLGMERSHLGE